MIKYRFYQYHNGINHYLMFDGDDYEPTEDRAEATLFTEREWHQWAMDDGFEREEIGTDEVMRLMGVEMLPGVLSGYSLVRYYSTKSQFSPANRQISPL